VCNSCIETPGCGKGATCVTMSRRPLGPHQQEPLIGGCRLFVFPAIAEYPGAEIRDFFVFRLQVEGAAGALGCVIAASLVE